jgi:hypothetical protein
LEHVFRVGRVTGNAVGRAEDEPVALLEDPFDGAGSRGCVDLSEREFQSTPPVFSRLKTGYTADYYRAGGIIFGREHIGTIWSTPFGHSSREA